MLQTTDQERLSNKEDKRRTLGSVWEGESGKDFISGLRVFRDGSKRDPERCGRDRGKEYTEK